MTKTTAAKMRVGILGGTFDPIHIGHLILAQEACHTFQLNCIYIMPNANPPHKDYEHISDVSHRINMIKLAIKDNENFVLSTVETDDTQKSYTYKTITELHRHHPDMELFFIMGADSLYSIEKWKNPDQIFQNCTLLSAVRDDVDQGELDEQIAYLTSKYHCSILRLPSFHLDISSKMIRKKVANKEPIKYYVTTDVENYIYNNRLYTMANKMNDNKEE